MREVIDNLKSERVKRIKSLYLKKNREKLSRFVVEGVNSVEELVKNFPEAVVEIIVNEQLNNSTWDARIQEIIKNAENKQLIIRTASKEVIDSISENCEGIIAIAKAEVFDIQNSKEQKEANNLTSAQFEQVVICKEVSDPGNAGTIIRAAAAFGLKRVVFVGNSVDNWNPKVIRASVGAVFKVAVENIPDLKTAVKIFRSSDFEVVATDGFGTSENPAIELQSFFENLGNCKNKSSEQTNGILRSSKTKIAWVFGNESQGLTKEDIQLCEKVVKIGLAKNSVESLNLAGAVNIVLYQGLCYNNLC